MQNQPLNDYFVVRESRAFKTAKEAEEYLAAVGYWAEPVLITDTGEADKFQRWHPIRDAAQDGRLHYGV